MGEPGNEAKLEVGLVNVLMNVYKYANPVYINPIVYTLSEPAQIVVHPNQTTAVDAGYTITFACVAYGDPHPFISWNRGDTPLSNDSRATIIIIIIMKVEELVTENGVTFVQSIPELCSTRGRCWTVQLFC